MLSMWKMMGTQTGKWAAHNGILLPAWNTRARRAKNGLKTGFKQPRKKDDQLSSMAYFQAKLSILTSAVFKVSKLRSLSSQTIALHKNGVGWPLSALVVIVVTLSVLALATNSILSFDSPQCGVIFAGSKIAWRRTGSNRGSNAPLWE